MPSLHNWEKLHMNHATLQEKQHNKEQYCCSCEILSNAFGYIGSPLFWFPVYTGTVTTKITESIYFQCVL